MVARLNRYRTIVLGFIAGWAIAFVSTAVALADNTPFAH